MKYAYNYWAVAVAAASCFLFGFIWFTVVFKEAYTEGLGKSREQMNQGPSMVATSVFQLAGNLVLAIVLSWLLKKLGCETILESVRLAALLWLGFIVAIIGPLYAHQAYSFKFFLIIAGAILMYILTSAVILTTWK
ncbi:DUF1761 domain-containing protein [Cytophaga hutchinsonii]|jgi:uncharacterized membrane protein (DUF106 family)|uniref:DUF1761 domain-containing protein n=1 Tax=Cytophaga hutchinsonii (strain ATCC 33406 / DSM 1761 / CIP 103989 / NBRC 15051 / NCIMB 9469 / D465) TaxID=269798 RepID=A0A6N4SRI3_CYTH3|nr:DUF1761 domain-containing protein [Cytophaga hutchinsonii]ABG58915.1 conserved hypothetical protein [Cytophaga hutchinsonii ATCC 33406]SFX81982.1 Protein of unknown function [Cytophaga hutchinsonii ATCC 33406]